ncbi:MAG: glycosyltransferase family protein [Ginsengibacter sp.]
MKILYAIQGTGNGHLSRARDIIPLLQQKGDLDILVSGVQADVELPYPVKYRFRGLSFIFGKKGGVDLLKTYKNSRLKRLYREIQSLPVHEYDLVISDFEPVSAWACRIKKKECIGLSHQLGVSNKKSPKPKKTDPVGKMILKKYAPVTYKYGFHFKAYDDNIFTPVIRKEVRELEPVNFGHYTVYLPSYDDKKIIKILKKAGNVKWHIFSKHTRKAYTKNNFIVEPISNESFIQSMCTCAGVLCGAGFETPAEALFLQKKLMVIPMKNQYEQHCNAAALKEMKVNVIKSLKKKHVPKIKQWIKDPDKLEVDFPDITSEIISLVIKNHAYDQKAPALGNPISTWKDFKNASLNPLTQKS